MTKQTSFAPLRLAVPAAALFAVAALPLSLQAATLSAGSAVEIGVPSTDLTDILADLNANTSVTDTDSVYEYAYDGDATGNYGGASAAANQDGWMYSTAAADNTAKAVSHVQQSLEITNDSGVAQNYSFDFTILAGSLETYVEGAGYDPNEFAAAGYLVSISLDGVELFGSAALLVMDDGGVGLQQSGESLGSYGGGGYYSWNALSDTLDLGEFAAGESFTLTYDIYTAAVGVFEGGDYPEGDGCYYEGEIYLEEGYCGEWSYSYAQFGDPNGVNGSPIAGNVSASPTSVPEPGLWLLMGTGLFGFAVARRRRG
jgi:hypothetical protein